MKYKLFYFQQLKNQTNISIVTNVIYYTLVFIVTLNFQCYKYKGHYLSILRSNTL